MSITAEEKAGYFKEELQRIYDLGVREFTRLCLIHAPDYIFLDCPSSSSGKFHPLDELSADGTLIHMKKVFTMAYDMVKALDCEDNRDIVLAASLIHDLRKRGPVDSGHSLKDHAAHAAILVDEVQDATQLLTKKQHEMLRNCVGYHYGPWSEGDWLKPIDNFTKEELALFLSDFVVSKRFIITDYRRDVW
jgi:hypothetical protein